MTRFNNVRILVGVFAALCCFGTVLAADDDLINIGDSVEQVVKNLGEPSGQVSLGDKTIFYYPSGEVEFVGGAVSRVNVRGRWAVATESVSVVGNTPAHIRRIYGAPIENHSFDKRSPLIRLPAAYTQTYQINEGWSVRVGYWNGVAHRIIYSKRPVGGSGYHIKDDERDALLKKHSDGHDWRATVIGRAQGALVMGPPVMTRSDGVRATSFQSMFRIETQELLDAEQAVRDALEAERIQRIPQ